MNDNNSPFPKLCTKGFHAYQKSLYELNTKAISWEKDKIFPCNQNKTGMIYFVITKGEGESPVCFLEISTPKKYHSEGLDISRFRTFRNTDVHTYQELRNVAVLYNIEEYNYDEEKLPNDLNIGGRNNKLKKWEKINKNNFICESKDEENYVLASKQIYFPTKAGKYSVFIFPLMGLNTNYRNYNSCLQSINLVFPYEFPFDAFGGIREKFCTENFRMVSKDPSNSKKRKFEHEENYGEDFLSC